MPRPQDPAVPTEFRECPEHGMVEFRLHKVGIDKRTGNQKMRWRCPLCHRSKNR